MKEGKEHILAFYSLKFSKPERNYCVTSKELLAVFRSLAPFHPYLYGAKFTVRTNQAALSWLNTLKDLKGQLARWLYRLEQYNYRIVHRHNNADSLSRRPCEMECLHCSRREADPQDPVCRRLGVGREASEVSDEWREAQQADSGLAGEGTRRHPGRTLGQEEDLMPPPLMGVLDWPER